jgi:hypothetical protein
MLMILENLDKNQRNTAELQGAIISFLAEKGFHAEGRAMSSFMDWFRMLVCFKIY